MPDPTRQEVLAILRHWQLGEWSTAQVHEEAERLWQSCGDIPDHPRYDPRSCIVDALAHLEMLNHTLVVRDDVPAFLQFLERCEGGPADAWRDWERYWNDVDWPARERSLAADPNYHIERRRPGAADQ